MRRTFATTLKRKKGALMSVHSSKPCCKNPRLLTVDVHSPAEKTTQTSMPPETHIASDGKSQASLLICKSLNHALRDIQVERRSEVLITAKSKIVR